MGLFDDTNLNDLISSMLNEKICRDCKKPFIPISLDDDLCDECKKKREDVIGDILGDLFGNNSSNAGATVFESSDETVYESPSDEATVAETVYEDFFNPIDNNKFSFSKGDLLLDTYRIDTNPIHGGMGSVWRVHHKNWDIDLAMKRPKKEYFVTDNQKETFIRECESWINLGLHPNIVSCYYVREIDGVPTIFSEWMENGDLESHIQDGSLYEGSKDEVQKRLLDIAIQFARGLHYAHETGLIHQDVKPGNLLISNEWNAKVSDFGLAGACSALTVLEGEWTVKEDNPTATIYTPSGGRSPAYCSPEQAASQALSRRTDIYSWAVSILEMYLGDRPWAHGTENTGPMVGSICEEYFDICKVNIPDKMKAVLTNCLETKPENRYHDFGEVEGILKEIYSELAGEEYPRPEPKASSDTADSLNNRALSYLDLGKEEEAVKIWERATLMDPSNTNSLFNRTLYSYRKNDISLYQAQCYLSSNWENHFNEAEPGILLAMISLEGEDIQNFKSTTDYINKYSPITKEMSNRLEKLEKVSQGKEYHSPWQISRILSIKELDGLQKKRDKKLQELLAMTDRRDYDEVCQELAIINMGREYGDALLQPDWMDLYRKLKRHCSQVHIMAQWPILRIPNVRRKDKVSFNDNSDILLCGSKLFDMNKREVIAENDNLFGADIDAIKNDLGGILGDDFFEMLMPKSNDFIYSRVSPDGKFFLCSMAGLNVFQIINARTGERIAECSEHGDNITYLAISRDGKRLASGGDKGEIHIWDADGKHLNSTDFLSGEEIEDIQFGYDSRDMMVRSEDRLVIMNHLFGNRSISYSNYLEASVDPAFHMVAMASGRDGFNCFDIDNCEYHRLSGTIPDTQGHNIYLPSKVCFLPNGYMAVVADIEGKKAVFYDFSTNRILCAIHTNDSVDDLAVSRDGRYLAVVSGGFADVWEIMYMFRYSPFDSSSEISFVNEPTEERLFLGACAHVLREANSEKTPDELLPEYIKELQDRGRGNIPENVALEILSKS